MSSIHEDERPKSSKDLEAAFATFDASRCERTQWLVQSSRRAGNLYEWRTEDVGKDESKIEKRTERKIQGISGALIWTKRFAKQEKTWQKDYKLKVHVS